MPRILRLQLTSDFRTAVLNDPRGVVRLARDRSHQLHRAVATALLAARAGHRAQPDRLQALASVVGFSGEVFRG